MPHCPACDEFFTGTRESVGARCPYCRQPLYERPNWAWKFAREELGVCAVHPDSKAVATCRRCGNFLCPVCRTRWRGRLLCVECAGRGAEADQAAPTEARTHMIHAVVAMALGVAGWGLTLLGFLLAAAAAGLGEQNGIGLAMLSLLTLCVAPLPAFVGLGQAVAALRIRGSHLVVAVTGLILCGLQVGALLGLLTFALLWWRG
jgi:hypothetical protein